MPDVFNGQTSTVASVEAEEVIQGLSFGSMRPEQEITYIQSEKNQIYGRSIIESSHSRIFYEEHDNTMKGIDAQVSVNNESVNPVIGADNAVVSSTDTASDIVNKHDEVPKAPERPPPRDRNSMIARSRRADARLLLRTGMFEPGGFSDLVALSFGPADEEAARHVAAAVKEIDDIYAVPLAKVLALEQVKMLSSNFSLYIENGSD